MWNISFSIYKENHRLSVILPAAIGRGKIPFANTAGALVPNRTHWPAQPNVFGCGGSEIFLVYSIVTPQSAKKTTAYAEQDSLYAGRRGTIPTKKLGIHLILFHTADRLSNLRSVKEAC